MNDKVEMELRTNLPFIGFAVEVVKNCTWKRSSNTPRLRTTMIRRKGQPYDDQILTDQE